MRAQQEKGRPLPKFGDWDVNNPATAEGFTVIFSKARDEKKSNGGISANGMPTTQKNDNISSKPAENYDYPPMVTI